MQMREKAGKSRNTVFFQWFVAPEGRKVGSLKRRVRSHLARWEMKKCTPLWREAHFVSEKVTKHTQRSDHFWKLRCRRKVHAVVARSTFQSQNVQNTPCVATTFGGSDVVSRGRRKGLCTLSKVSKAWGFLAFPNHGRCGTFEEDLQRCIFCGRGSTKDMFMRHVMRSGRWFPERGCILEHQICRFAKMILRDRCSTSYDLASISRGRRKGVEKSQNALVRGCQRCT